jgi:hypothetical protein
MKKQFITVVMLFSLSSIAMADQCVQNNNKVGFVGLDSTDGGTRQGNLFVSVSNHNNGCGCSHFRFYSGNTDTKSALSILLTARTTEKPVRIDLLDSTNCDSAYRVYIQ